MKTPTPTRAHKHAEAINLLKDRAAQLRGYLAETVPLDPSDLDWFNRTTRQLAAFDRAIATLEKS